MRASASKLRLLDHCGWWAQDDVRPPPGDESTYARMGKAFHSLVEGVDTAEALAGLSEDEIDTVSEWHEAWSASPWAKVQWQHEVAFAWDPESDTARLLPAKGARDYSDVQGAEIPGTADLVYVDHAAGIVFVPDTKTGFQGNAEPIERHTQLRFLALCAARAFMFDRVRIQILHLDGIELRTSEYELDAAELSKVAAETRARLARTGGAPQPGAHCKSLYCPAMTVCPQTQALARKQLVDFPLAPPESDMHALWLRDGADLLEDLSKNMRAWARKYADEHGGVSLPDGKVWKRIEQDRETIALNGPGGAEAEDLLARAGLAEAVEHKATASKEGIKKLLAKRGLKGKALTEALENVLIPLRVAGATRTTLIPKYVEEKP